MTSTETAVETRTIVYETHPDGSPALWLETASDGTRTLIDDGKTPVVLYPGEDVDEAVAQWRVAVGVRRIECNRPLCACERAYGHDCEGE